MHIYLYIQYISAQQPSSLEECFFSPVPILIGIIPRRFPYLPSIDPSLIISFHLPTFPVPPAEFFLLYRLS